MSKAEKLKTKLENINSEFQKLQRDIVRKCLLRSKRVKEDLDDGSIIGIEKLVEVLAEVAARGGDLNLIYSLFFSEEVIDLQGRAKEVPKMENEINKLRTSFYSRNGERKSYGNVKKSLNPALKNIIDLPFLVDVPGFSENELHDINMRMKEIPALIELYFQMQSASADPLDKTLKKKIDGYFKNKRVNDAMNMLIDAGYRKTPAAEALSIVMEYAPTEDGEPLTADMIIKRYDRYKPMG